MPAKIVILVSGFLITRPTVKWGSKFQWKSLTKTSKTMRKSYCYECMNFIQWGIHADLRALAIVKRIFTSLLFFIFCSSLHLGYYVDPKKALWKYTFTNWGLFFFNYYFVYVFISTWINFDFDSRSQSKRANAL